MSTYPIAIIRMFGAQRLLILNKPTPRFFCSFLEAVPTAELEPITEDYVQADEVYSITLHAAYRVLTLLLRGPGRHGNDIRGIVRVRPPPEDREVWPL